jgi:hypothetical protein
MLICAVPECSSSQRALHSGNLHLIDTPIDGAEAGSPQSRKKYVWLCSECSKTHVVQTWRPAGEQIRHRKPNPALPFPAHAEAKTTTETPRPFLLSNAS